MRGPDRHAIRRHAIRRRALFGLPLAVAALHPAVGPALAAGKPRSHAATYGYAPFATEHLIPGADLDLSTVDPDHPAARVIALTIDDGPDPQDLRILEVLRRHGAGATFFFIGRKLDRQHDLTTQVAASGHEIGSHSWEHPMMTDLPPAGQLRSLDATNAAFGRIGLRPAWFRPPYGDFDAAVEAAARARGLQTVLWTVDSQDWKGTDAATIGRRVVDRLHPGAVVLMHSTKPASLQALPDILAAGASRGYRFVTLSAWREAMRQAVTVPMALHLGEPGRPAAPR
ncbi:polysaccharide deacetylase family protein [Azospirillum thermophilum]|uniref:Chitooligosaccharide deacetylase n=1 Tax=Azospirillum thermophilum TaxID=2202148 RepID=A0A2S2CYB1_9PROT|nr:polysaccharide deacetylase family protein [Azospirillum thermophilum]AWK89459.1 polysaccharide deacetylase family protein [Azospirillum thermophilum]